MSARILSLAKGKHRYIFRYTAGNEGRVIDEIMAMADDPQTGLDWLDAATLGFQVAHYTATGKSAAEHAAAAIPGGVLPRSAGAFGDQLTGG